MRINARVNFLEITSNEKRIPAIGLLNRTVIPAAIPAQISSVLYCLNILCFRCATAPIVAVATTVETSIPVDPPETTVNRPFIK